MTRINVGINPKQLTDEHLRSEYREIQRLPSYYRKAVKSGSINRIPKKFTLGQGHVRFFLDKWSLIASRFSLLHEEMLFRDFKRLEEYDNFPQCGRFARAFKYIFINAGMVLFKHYKGYEPTSHDRQLLIERITHRITKSPKKYWHYYGKRITPEEAIELLTKNET